VTRRPAARGLRAAAARRDHALLAALAGAGDHLTVDIDGAAVAFTHLDRVYWPADAAFARPPITKRDYLRYLVEVAPVLLRHVRDRPLTLFRWPEGISGRRVLEKHWAITLPAFVERVDVFSESKGRPDPYILCNNLATLLWLAHMGTLEFHMWHSRVRTDANAPDAGDDFQMSLAALRNSILERPDYLLFDLDPFIGEVPPGMRDAPLDPAAFEKVKAIALSVHALLADIGLASLVKTSGKTGLHVIVPIVRSLRYDAVREMATYIAARLLREHRHDVTIDWSIERRTGKVFIDSNMNARGKSITVPYSPRGLPGAPVSMPLTWDALRDALPTDFRVPTVPACVRADGDAWAGWLERKQDVMDRLALGAA
jgi:bifunctional non-homologous end joining protein LigD